MEINIMEELAIFKFVIKLFEILWIILRRIKKMQNRYFKVDRIPVYYFIYKNQ
jgi:hypothetical protein